LSSHFLKWDVQTLTLRSITIHQGIRVLFFLLRATGIDNLISKDEQFTVSCLKMALVQAKGRKK
jgi:hypothetical protein